MVRNCIIKLFLCFVLIGFNFISLVAQQPQNYSIKIQISDNGVIFQDKIIFNYNTIWDPDLLADYLDWDSSETKDYGWISFRNPGLRFRILKQVSGRDKYRISNIVIPFYDDKDNFSGYSYILNGKVFFNSTLITCDSNINDLLDCLKPGIKLNRLKREEGYREYRVDFNEKVYMTLRIKNNPRKIVSISLMNDIYDENYNYEE